MDIGLKQCFDRINHDILMGRIAEREPLCTVVDQGEGRETFPYPDSVFASEDEENELSIYRTLLQEGFGQLH